jgi:uncharacterized iron-regulated membrane protein
MNAQLYRAVWRWHFLAGLLTLPVLVLLAITGALYLFKPEIHNLLYREMVEVVPRASAPASPSALRASVEAAMQGRVVQLTLPGRNDRSVEALVRVPSGEVRNAYIDPYDAKFLGSTEAGGAMQIVKKLHSLSIVGTWGNVLVEIAAGWAIIMVLTGIYLWWPRGAKGGVLTVRGKPGQRLFWRDFHAVTGVLAAAVILFLAVTGMPWSTFWGANIHKWVAINGLGAPKPPADVTPRFMLASPRKVEPAQDHAHHDAVPERPWGLKGVVAPQSHGSGHEIGIDAAVARFETLGLQKPYGLQPPESDRGAYAATYTPGKVDDIRLVYLNQYTGELISETRYSDYGIGAKAIEWGVAVHQGQQYGEVNRLVMLTGCLAILALAVSSIAMWWKRRPRGRIGVPPRAGRAEVYVLGAIAVVGVLYPLTGLSFVAAAAVDAAFGRLRTR